MKNKIIGHRGYGVIAPENTLYSLEHSSNLGLSYVEFDIRLTNDDVIVVSHDDSLSRCAGDERLISQTDYKDLERVNMAGTHALGQSMFAKIPTLYEYMEKASDLNLICQIELKPNANDIEKLCRLAAQQIEDFYKNKNENLHPLITSFNPQALKMFKEYCSLPLETGILVKVNDTHEWKLLAEQSQCDFVHVNVIYLTKEIAENIKSAGYRINAYHLNHIGLAIHAVSLGCERFTCDIPDVFLEQLKKA